MEAYTENEHARALDRLAADVQGADAFILWGAHPDYGNGQPLKIMGGTLLECRRESERRGHPWHTAIRKPGEPSGLDWAIPPGGVA